ncbi:DUF4394 domain-containing protein [Nevskia soli]|uniref:DUF4394 domain-containing protein n=1 Tax=Nevskia soli TaxID=418856 RepID=UPI0004A6E402|nr:DUF4394 domain-containing protein [Nevskia soli]
MLKSARIALLLAATLAMAGCQKDFTAYALTSSGSIVQFKTNKPGTVNSTVPITGLSTGQSVVQISYQPSTGVLWCITNDGFLCTLDPVGGTATIVNTTSGLPFTQQLGNRNNTVRLINPLMSFDPVSGDVRVISTQYNLLVNITSGLIDNNGSQVVYDSQDVNDKKTPQLGGIAYTNPVVGAGQTTLYALDIATTSLVRIGDKNTSNAGSANGGDLRTIGTLNSSLSTNTGFAISPDNGDAYAVLQSGGPATLYTVDLDTGALTSLGQVGGDNNSQEPTITSLVISR